jgi:hypothetical protein
MQRKNEKEKEKSKADYALGTAKRRRGSFPLF